MVDIVTRLGKGSPLTNAEVDANFTNLAEVSGVTGEPMGHEDRTTSTISFNASTRTFTIAPTASSFTVWCKGKKVVISSAQTLVIPNTTGMHSIYYDANGTLSSKIGYFTFSTETPTAYVYWNATTGAAPYFGDERHGVVLDWQTHEYLHRTRGAVIANGFLASGYTLNNSATDAATQIAIESGTFFDEDMKIDIVSTATPTAGAYQQNLLFPAKIPVLHLQGTSWVMDAPTDFPFKQGTSRPQYNSVSGGVWSTADVGNNQHATTWILATNNLTYPVIAIIGQSATDNLGEAEAFSFADLTLTGFPSVEFRPLYKLIYKASDGYANSVNAQLVSIVDLRSISAVGSAANPATDHGNLSGLSDDDHPQYLSVDIVRGSLTAAVKASFLPSQTSNAGKFLQTDGTATSWAALTSGNVTTALGFTPYNATNPSGFITGITSGNVTTALGFTPYNATNPSGYVTAAGARGSISVTGAGSYDSATGVINIVGGVTSFNTRTGAITLSSSDVTTALGFTPYNSTNPNGYLTGITSTQVTTALGYTPYNSSNPSGYITGITSGMVTTALGFTPYNNSNPSGYITSAALSPYLTTASAASTYLALSGGTMTGIINMAGTQKITTAGYAGIEYYNTAGNWEGYIGTENNTGNLRYNARLGTHTWYANSTSIGAWDASSLRVSGSVLTTTGASSWGVYSNTNGSNYSGIWFSTNVGELLLRTADGSLSTRIAADGSYAFINNNNILHAGNYSSYALPLSGGTLSGDLTLGGSNTYFGGSTYLRSNSAFNFLTNSGNAQNGKFNGIQVSDSYAGSVPANGILFGTETTLVRDGAYQLSLSGNRLLHAGNYSSYPQSKIVDAGGTGKFLTLNSTNELEFYNAAGTAIETLYLQYSGAADSLKGPGGNTILHAGNYNSYAPTLTGGGASGTWGVRITGFANAGSQRLYSTDSSYNYDSANPYFGYLTYNGAANRWRFKVSPATPDAVEVAYADAAGSAGSADYANLTNKTGGTGTYTTSGDYRAPIFYDSNDTAYYADLNGQSYMRYLRIAGDWGGSVDTAQLGIRGTYPSITFRSTNSNAVWLRHMDGAGDIQHYYTSGTDSNSWTVRHSMTSGGTFSSIGDHRAPIFYDSNNTAYYLDPTSSTSLNAAGDLRYGTGGSNTGSFIYHGSSASDYGVVRFYQAGTNNSTIHAFSTNWQGGTLQSTAAGSINLDGANGTTIGQWNVVDMWIAKDGNSQSRTSSRAPIFYDSNDTAYYVDPNGTSQLSLGRFQIPAYGGGSGVYSDSRMTLSVGGSGLGSIVYQSQYNDANYPDYGMVFIHGASGGNRNVWSISPDGPARGNSLNFLYDLNSTNIHVGTTRFRLDGSGNTFSQSSSRAPIFYDSDNTGTYINPNGASVISSGGSYPLQLTSTQRYLARFYNSSATGAGWWLANDSNTLVFHADSSGDKASLNSDGVFITTGSFRAPLFYDNNDTAYYTDPASTSNVNLLHAQSIVVTGTTTDRNVVRAIPKGASASYNNTVTGAFKIRLPFRANDMMWMMTVKIYDYSGNSISEYQIGNYSYSAGAYQIAASFFGSNNAASRTVRLGNDGSYDCVWIGETSSTWSHPVIAVTDFMGGYANASASVIDDNWDISLATSFGTIGGTINPTNRFYSVTAESAISAPIFYDSNDTTYYVDPNSTGVALRIAGAIRGDHVNWTGEHNKIQWHSAHMYFQNMADGYWIFRKSTGAEPFLLHADGWGQASGSWRAPIFYDSQDTAYYTDPNSYSNLSRLNVNYATGNGSTSNVAVNISKGWTGMSTAIYDTVSIQSNDVTSIRVGEQDGTTGGYCQGDGYNTFTSTSPMRFFTGGSATAYIYNGMSGTQGLYINSGVIYSNGFYDNQDTGYYTDPNGGSALKYLRVDGNWGGSPFGSSHETLTVTGTYASICQRATSGNLTYVLHHVDDQWSLYIGRGATNGSDWNWAIRAKPSQDGNYVEFRTSARAPVFYDLEDTGYYVNPNGSSYLHSLILSGNSYFRPNNWIQMDSSAGIYWPNHYGAHLYPNAGGTYTQLQIDGQKNGYSGMYISHSAVNGMMYDSAGNGGVYREANGKWYFYHNISNDCIGLGTSSTNSAYGVYCNKGAYLGGRVDGTIFYDANNTTYYVDPNDTGTSVRVAGNVTAYYSDMRLKTHLGKIENALDKVRQLEGFYYEANEIAQKLGYKPKREVGVSAQAVNVVLPEIVTDAPINSNYLTIDYERLTPLLIEAMKEQDKEVVDLRNRVAQLESLINKLIGD